MPYWEYEYFTKFANEMIEEENKQQKEGNEDYSMDAMERKSNSMMRNASSQFKMPKMPSISTPKI
jgi:hypothetical protein